MTEKLRILIHDTLLDGKAEDVVYLPVEKQAGGLFAGMFIVTAGGRRHAAALSDRLLRALKSAGYKKIGVEATETRDWTLLDCGDIVVHVMQAEARAHYRLDALWTFEGEDGGDADD